jgi:predicted transcriptional regulator
MALCIAHGIAFLGRATTRRRVLYVNLELKPSTFDRRVQAIAKALKITVDKSWFYHLPLRGQMAGLRLSEIVPRLISVCGHYEAGVIAVDPCFKLNIEGEENSSRDQTLFSLEVDRLTTEAKCTVLLNDHAGKGNQSEKDPLDVIRGSSAKGGDLDAAMVLRKHEVEHCFRVDMVHRELPPVEPFCIGWKYPLMELRPDLNAEAMKKPKGGQTRKHDPRKLLAAIKETTAEKGISVSAWAEKMEITRQTLQGYLKQMRDKGWISTSGEGNAARKFITSSGKEAVSKWESET